MTRLFLIVVLAGALLLGGADPDPGDLNPPVAVTLTANITTPERAALEARLKAYPQVVRVETVNQKVALAKLKLALKDDAEMLAALDRIDLAKMPVVLDVVFRHRAAAERFAASDGPAELRGMPGVDQVSIQLHESPPAVSKCMEGPKSMLGAPDIRTVTTFLSRDVDETDKRAVEQRLRAVPGAVSVTLTTKQQAWEKYQELFRDMREAPKAEPGDLPESWVLTLESREDLRMFHRDNLSEAVCRMPGVESVVVPPMGE